MDHAEIRLRERHWRMALDVTKEAKEALKEAMDGVCLDAGPDLTRGLAWLQHKYVCFVSAVRFEAKAWTAYSPVADEDVSEKATPAGTETARDAI